MRLMCNKRTNFRKISDNMHIHKAMIADKIVKKSSDLTTMEVLLPPPVLSLFIVQS